jgi:hypothetical protein
VLTTTAVSMIAAKIQAISELYPIACIRVEQMGQDAEHMGGCLAVRHLGQILGQTANDARLAH